MDSNETHVTTESEDAFYHLQTMQRVDVLDHRTMEGDGGCGNIMVGGKDMSPLIKTDELKKSEEGAHELRVYREKLAVECGNGEIVRQRIIKEYLPTFERGDVQAILVETPNMDPAASATFMEKYEELFDKRHPYVDKVASTYLCDPSGLQNVMPDETGPTPGQGPRPSPTVSIS
ncbi:hypothetical protein Tco_0019405 [Tanacetum coccineum]